MLLSRWELPADMAGGGKVLLTAVVRSEELVLEVGEAGGGGSIGSKSVVVALVASGGPEAGDDGDPFGDDGLVGVQRGGNERGRVKDFRFVLRSDDIRCNRSTAGLMQMASDTHCESMSSGC